MQLRPPSDLLEAGYRLVAVTRLGDNARYLASPALRNGVNRDEVGSTSWVWQLISRSPLRGFVQNLGSHASLPQYAQAIGLGLLDQMRVRPKARSDEVRRDAIIKLLMDDYSVSTIGKKTSDFPMLDGNDLQRLALQMDYETRNARRAFTVALRNTIESEKYHEQLWIQPLYDAYVDPGKIDEAAERFFQDAPPPDHVLHARNANTIGITAISPREQARWSIRPGAPSKQLPSGGQEPTLNSPFERPFEPQAENEN